MAASNPGAEAARQQGIKNAAAKAAATKSESPPAPKSGGHPYYQDKQMGRSVTKAVGRKYGNIGGDTTVSVQKANRIVLLTIGGAFGIGLISRLSKDPAKKIPGSLIKMTIGATMAVVILMVVSEVSPKISIAFGWLILVGAIATDGGAVFNTATTAVGGTVKGTVTTVTATGPTIYPNRKA